MNTSVDDLAYQLSDINFKYQQKTVLEIDRLAIKKNQITTLIGSNGSGKSSLLNLLSFLDFADQGRIKFFGEIVEKKTALRLRRRVALVSQSPYLLRGTVLENINLGLNFRGYSKSVQAQRSQRAMETVGINEFANRKVQSLSGGEAQKVSLARALALQTEVLLMDEPFSHLDQKSIDQLEELLQSLCVEQGMTVILSTHDHAQGLALSDQGINLVAGKPVDAPLLNLFYGQVREHYFVTDKLRIFLPDDVHEGKHIAVDPAEIVLSSESLTSSMRNNFPGRVIAILEEKGRVWICINIGEKIHAQITQESLVEMSLNLGSDVWVNFKSTAIKIF